MSFNGANIRVDPGANFVLTEGRTVEGYLKAGQSAHFCTCEPIDKKAKVFDPVNADISVHPAEGHAKEESLEEVKLYTRLDFLSSFLIPFFCFLSFFFGNLSLRLDT